MNQIINNRIGFIGAGKAGVTLGAYFRSKGLDVAGYASRSRESANNAALITSSGMFTTIKELVTECGIIFITTPDGQIEDTWNKIACHDIKNKIICHTSGALTSDIFVGIAEKGAFGFSVHPMYAFSERSGCIGKLETAYFTIEGNRAHIDKIKNILSITGNKLLVIDSDSKALYHLANVMVSNLMLALLKLGCECMSGCGIDEDTALKALMPLVLNNIYNIERNGFINSLTGPAERNDIDTVLKHLETMPNHYKHIYRDLSKKLIELSAKKHPNRDFSGLLKLLEEYPASRIASGDVSK